MSLVLITAKRNALAKTAFDKDIFYKTAEACNNVNYKYLIKLC